MDITKFRAIYKGVTYRGIECRILFDDNSEVKRGISTPEEMICMVLTDNNTVVGICDEPSNIQLVPIIDK